MLARRRSEFSRKRIKGNFEAHSTSPKTMSFLHIVLAFFLAFTQRSLASYEHGHGFGAIPIGVVQQPVMAAPVVHAHVVPAAPVVHAHVMPAPVVQPVVAAPPPVIAAPAPVPVPVPVPYVHEHHHHAPVEIHNRVGAYHKGKF
ncbi:hypothetical protein ANCCEY_04641 [Ancylostoma ceylanicum]|uniref:Uncharacterized protein n=1 Tax=Ancylostoma ceylanicum TaxID=53326 RepID=A0A0D6LWV6_9BILA|nr:hypothetical protein ANCCEY_04641 [Ancylostoma ceylanicum]